MSKKSSFLMLIGVSYCHITCSSFSTRSHFSLSNHKQQKQQQQQHPHPHPQNQPWITTTKSPISIESKSRLFAAASPTNIDESSKNNSNEKKTRTINKIESDSDVTATSKTTTTTRLSSSSDSNENKDSKESIETQRNKSKNISTKETTSTREEIQNFSEDKLGRYDPYKKLDIKREVLVGNPQIRVKKDEISVTEILTELAAIQKQGPQKYCILGTRHCSYLHQQIIELLSYALVLSENHVYTSGAMGTNGAAIRGALRAGRPDLLTVILPQSLHKQPDESQELLREVTDLVTMPQNDKMSLDVASRLCNSKLLSETDQLVAFAFHESTTVIEATTEAKKLDMLVTTLFLD